MLCTKIIIIEGLKINGPFSQSRSHIILSQPRALVYVYIIVMAKYPLHNIVLVEPTVIGMEERLWVLVWDYNNIIITA